MLFYLNLADPWFVLWLWKMNNWIHVNWTNPISSFKLSGRHFSQIYWLHNSQFDSSLKLITCASPISAKIDTSVRSTNSFGLKWTNDFGGQLIHPLSKAATNVSRCKNRLSSVTYSETRPGKLDEYQSNTVGPSRFLSLLQICFGRDWFKSLGHRSPKNIGAICPQRGVVCIKKIIMLPRYSICLIHQIYFI